MRFKVLQYVFLLSWWNEGIIRRAEATKGINVDSSLTEKKFDVKKQGRKAGGKFSKYLRDQILRYASANCRRTNGFKCSHPRSAFTETCGDFCVNGGAWGCFGLVLDIAVASFDIVSNFVPVGKVFTAAKMANKARKIARSGGTGLRAAQEAAEKARKEIAKEFYQNMRDLFMEKTYVWTFIENTALGQTGQASYVQDEVLKIFLDEAIEEACEDLATAHMYQMAKDDDMEAWEKKKVEDVEKNSAYTEHNIHSGNPRFKDFDGMTREEELAEFRSIMADIDPTGVINLVNKFMGPTCDERLLAEPYPCKFTIPWPKEDDCCAGISAERGRFWHNGNLHVLCNNVDGTDSCRKDKFTTLTAYTETFVDAQLDFYASDLGGSTKGLYFQISSKSDFESMFPDKGYCHVFYDEKYKDCSTENGYDMKGFCKIIYGAQETHDGEFIPGYLQMCLQPTRLYKVRQCRNKYLVWEGDIRIFEKDNGQLIGRRSSYSATNFEWETGDVIVPWEACCPEEKDSYKIPARRQLGSCEDNINWESKGLGCDWVAKNPARRCHLTNTYGVRADDKTDGCRNACECKWRNRPNDEPVLGARVEAHVKWGSENGVYFKLASTWAQTAWNIMGLSTDQYAYVEAMSNSVHKLVDVQQCRNGMHYWSGVARLFTGDNVMFGRWDSNFKKSDWHDGDVILPPGFPCRDTDHDLKKGIDHVPTDQPSMQPSESPSALGGRIKMFLDINTDFYPRETTWKFYSYSAGKYIYRGGPYIRRYGTYEEVFRLKPGKYKFEIHDSYKDGLDGSYILRMNEKEICSGGKGRSRPFKDIQTCSFNFIVATPWLSSMENDCGTGISAARGKFILNEREHVLCNNVDGTDSCSRDKFSKVTAYEETFVDAQLKRDVSDLDSATEGLYFQIDSKSDFESMFPDKGYCHVVYEEQYKECSKNGFDLTEHRCKVILGAACCTRTGDLIPGYLQLCVQKDALYKVRQCRKKGNGYLEWEGAVRIFEKENGELFGRRSYSPSNYQWKNGDVIVPWTACCPNKEESYKVPVRRTMAPTRNPTPLPKPPHGCRVHGIKKDGENYVGQSFTVLAEDRATWTQDFYYSWDSWKSSGHWCKDACHHRLCVGKAPCGTPQVYVKQCRNGAEVWEGYVYIYEDWTGRVKEDAEYARHVWKRDDVLSKFGCHVTVPGPPSVSPTRRPTRYPTTARPTSPEDMAVEVSGIRFREESSYLTKDDHKGQSFIVFSDYIAKFDKMFPQYEFAPNSLRVRHCRDGKEVWHGVVLIEKTLPDDLYFGQIKDKTEALNHWENHKWKRGDVITKANIECNQT